MRCPRDSTAAQQYAGHESRNPIHDDVDQLLSAERAHDTYISLI